MLDFDFNQIKNNRRQNLGFDLIEELRSLSNPEYVKISDNEIRFIPSGYQSIRHTLLSNFTNNSEDFLKFDAIRYLKNHFDLYCKSGSFGCPFIMQYLDPIKSQICLNLIKIAKTIDHCYFTLGARETDSKLLIEASGGKVLIYHHYRGNGEERNYPILAKSKVYYIGFSMWYNERNRFNINDTLNRIIYNKELGACQIDCEKLVIRIKDEYRRANNQLISLLEDLLNSGNFINPNMRIGFCSHGTTFPKFLQNHFPNSFFFTFPKNYDEFFDYEDVKDL